MAHDLEKADGAKSPWAQVDLEPKRKLTGVKWFFFNISTLTAIFLYALDNTVVANIQPSIVGQFDAVDKLPWLSVGFMIGGLSMVMPLGKLYALYDAKILFIFFAINFMAASALCGGAPNMPAEIIGRVWAGAGGNGMYYGLLNLVSTNTLERERPTYLSLTGMIWGVGTVLGPVVGGAFELYTWRWAFYINLLFGAIIVPAYLFLIPSNNPAPSLTLREKIITFDWLGAILSTGGFVTLIVATNFGGDLYAWNSGTIIALYVVSGVLWILLMLQQTFTILTTVEHRMFPVHLLRNREAILLCLLASCGGSIAYITVYYIPLYYQFTRGDSAIKTAERILPLIFLLIFGMLSNGYLMSKFGWYKPWYVCGAAISLVGAVLMSRLKLESSNSEIYGYQVLIGLGAGSFAHASFAVIQTAVNPKDTVYGVTLIMLGQLCGLTIGLSVTGALFINLAKSNLQAVFPTVDKSTLASVVSGTSGGFLETQSDTKKSQALAAIVSALQDVFTDVYVVAALACILSVFLKWRKVYTEGIAGGIV
ncbi:hypothetical protein ETB97_008281 [Aspergillus alliaceus]|uniref:Major facilitator superfamily (MFS) profile domain-containing protein n=1 Tax=Petromyces alliaceus TaxID=209559 RepID=A0A8H5ZWX2_PETAA|nr:hypothetical protein ETB97_008281 [Aspergillus burnettii]